MCLYCKKVDQVNILQDLILRSKYTQVFTFFFSQPINDILSNKRQHHVYLFKEYLFYDDEQEYMEELYETNEAKNKLKNLQKKINDQQHLQPLLQDIQIHFQIRQVFHIERKQKIRQIKKKHERNLLHKHPAEFSIPESLKDQGQDRKSFVQDLERHCENLSFETQVHDIYNPEFSHPSQDLIHLGGEFSISPFKKQERKKYQTVDMPQKLVQKLKKLNTQSNSGSFKILDQKNCQGQVSTLKNVISIVQQQNHIYHPCIKESSNSILRSSDILTSTKNSVQRSTKSFKHLINQKIMENAFNRSNNSSISKKKSDNHSNPILASVHEFYSQLVADRKTLTFSPILGLKNVKKIKQSIKFRLQDKCQESNILIKDENQDYSSCEGSLINKSKPNPKTKSLVQCKTEVNSELKQKIKRNTPVIVSQQQTASQLFKKLSDCLKDQQGGTRMDSQEKKTQKSNTEPINKMNTAAIQNLIQRYSKFISYSPYEPKSPTNEITQSKYNLPQQKIKNNVSIYNFTNSMKITHGQNKLHEQWYLYGFTSNAKSCTNSNSKINYEALVKSIERKKSFNK